MAWFWLGFFVLLFLIAFMVNWKFRRNKDTRDYAIPLFVAFPVLTFLLLLVGYIGFVNHTEIQHLGVAYDSVTGKITKQTEPGWYITPPTTSVAYISLMPMIVKIPSDAKIINQRLVRFNPAGLDEYIALQGFSSDMNKNLENTLLGYAFSGQKYSFLEIMEEPDSTGHEPKKPK